MNTKGKQIYTQIQPWLGRSLFTSSGELWHAKRKLITKAFHFQILQDFLPVMNQHVDTLMEDILPKHADTDKSVDITLLLKNYTMDVICEAAMGVNMDIQHNPDAAYPKAVACLTRVSVDKAVSCHDK